MVASGQEAQAKEKQPEQAKADAEKALAQQEQLNEKLEALKDQLRADANKQDVLQADQRERARDADDALAMLKDPPPAASDALKDAAEAHRLIEEGHVTGKIVLEMGPHSS